MTTDSGASVPEGVPEDPPEYDFADERPDDARIAAVSGAATEAPAPVLAYRPPRADSTATAGELYFPSRPRDLYVPIALLLFGIALGMGELIYLSNDGVAPALAFGSAYAVIKLLMLVVCIPLLTRLAGVSFGTLPQAVLKLCAIAILPEAIALLIILFTGWFVGPLIALPIGLIACCAMFAVLFEFDIAEARLCAVIYWGIGLVFGAGWLTLFHWMLGWAW